MNGIGWGWVALLAVGWIDGAAGEVVTWDFPRTDSCHEGMPFADGTTGVLVWGGGGDHVINLTVGRSDLWDHRGGYAWTDEQSYTNIVAAVQSGDVGRLQALFRKETPPGEPRNPYMLPLGRVTLAYPADWILRFGTLDTATGLGELVFERLHSARGRTCETNRVSLAMSSESRLFAMEFPKGFPIEVACVSATEREPFYSTKLRPYGFERAVKGAYGFDWKLPADEPVWLDWTVRDGTFYLATGRGAEHGHDAARAAERVSFSSLRASVVRQWSDFWKASARICVPDATIQRLYEYGMYKFGSMTRPDGPPAGLQGPWLEDDRLVPWNGDYHFNINVQECYSPAYRGGHPENLRPLFDMVLSWRPRLRDNARRFVGIDDGYVLPHSVDDRGVCIGGFWTGTTDHGSTAWVADMMYRYVKYSGDRAFLKSDAYDFMKGAMNVYRAMMVVEDGRLSIPLGPSPEWGGSDVRRAVGRDPSFQLAAAHRLARDLIDAARRLGEEPDPMWLDVERRLPPFSEGPDGIELFRGQALSESHRHHSHMAAFFPFDTLDLGDGRVREVASRTYANWVRRGTGQWTGWCVPWASVLHTHVGNARAAVELLHSWDAYFCNPGHGSLHNAYAPGFTAWTVFGSFAGSGDGQVMQMDGQCAAAAAVLELLVHEVNGKTEFFRGCPASWRDVSFENLLLSDGRRVSARRRDGVVCVDGKFSLTP